MADLRRKTGLQRAALTVVDAVREPRGAWVALGLLMVPAAALILYAIRGQGFAVDELFYYGRVAEKQGVPVHFHPFALEYLLAPFNGHLPLGGRFVYELVFATVGARYHVFAVVNIFGLLLCVALTFELVRRRVGPLAALAPCIVLLFLGYAREQLLWPLDFNTSLSLASGLAAVLAVQRGDRRGDILACALLLVSTALIEVGLSFALGLAVWLLLEGRRGIRRLWVVIMPLALYAAWWVWAHKFGQEQTHLSNAHLIPKTLLDAVASVLGSVTGTNPILPGIYATTVTWFGRGLAVVASAALAVRLWRGRLPRTIWVWLAVIGSYWVLLAIAARPPAASRYIFVGAVLVFLIAADAVGRRLSDRVAAGLIVLALVALPANVEQLLSHRNGDALHHDTPVSRAEFAMLELSRQRVDPEYVASADERVVHAGGGLYIGLPAGAYLDAAEHNGSIAFSLDELRRQSPEIRAIADATLVGALRIALRQSGPPNAGHECRTHAVEAGAQGTTFEIPAGRTLLRPVAGGTPVWLRRFADPGGAVEIGSVKPGRWTALTIPSDGAADPWHVVAESSLRACSAPQPAGGQA